MGANTLYERLGGYDLMSAVANDLPARLRIDPGLAAFIGHVNATLNEFALPPAERNDVIASCNRRAPTSSKVGPWR